MSLGMVLDILVLLPPELLLFNAAFGGAIGSRRQSHHHHHHHHVRKLSSSALNSNISGGSNTNISNTIPSGISWEVFVSQANTSNKDKGVLPASSIMESFASFSPSPGVITVNAAIFHNQPSKAIGKGKGHLVRCIQKKEELTLSAIEINNVDSVEKVYRIVTEHMRLTTVTPKACDCMKLYFEGNESLDDEGDPSKAIALYNQALSLADRRTRQTSQVPKGSILMKRARAYLQRAANHRKILRSLVKDLTDTVPSASTMKILYQTASSHPELSSSIFQRLAGDSKVNQGKFRQIRYRHDMHEFALLHATQDSLQATKLLPRSADAWYIAGECLAELRKLNESNQYYVRALALDPSRKDVLTGLMEKNKLSQEFMDKARASGFSGDTLRLAVDVAAS
eukprot:CAMPEP_0201695080 /NCGR_PEP_ID=MMETSP0578-20130828/7149_1 /ASSEMBLY_ACC=CAM_ASM_000663 /TAXON_ID=267565 /ORGANISM="Skeletonema grethea, Strain CCMP 1804" /LENGTH=396 /DNA_ID=CAMNT_0048180869 /DNA_START=35 /DNA_END=1225 /DNA_ORIENTATION=-